MIRPFSILAVCDESSVLRLGLVLSHTHHLGCLARVRSCCRHGFTAGCEARSADQRPAESPQDAPSQTELTTIGACDPAQRVRWHKHGTGETHTCAPHVCFWRLCLVSLRLLAVSHSCVLCLCFVCVCVYPCSAAGDCTHKGHSSAALNPSFCSGDFQTAQINALEVTPLSGPD